MKSRSFTHLSLGLGKNALMAVAVSVAAFSLSFSAPTALAADKSKLMTEVHFDPGSVDVTFGGKKKIDAVIAAINKHNPREIHVIGFTDSTGDEQMNRAIARDRADNVARLLTEQGITVPLVVEGKGENGAPYKIPDNVSEPLNRCVGIIAVGKAEKTKKSKTL